jgi:hypothetical protein
MATADAHTDQETAETLAGLLRAGAHQWPDRTFVVDVPGSGRAGRRLGGCAPRPRRQAR